MDREENRINNISQQRQKVAPLIHGYAVERRVKSKAPIEELAELLFGILHHSDQAGITFNDALAKARVKYLEQKRPIH